MKRLLTLFAATTLSLGAAEQSTTRFSADAPVINFRLPMFTPEGNRAWLVRGSEARFASANEIDIRELTMTLFTGDATDRVETMILSPQARVLTNDAVATGTQTIRVINDSFEATGSEWRYNHREKRISIAKNVRVTFRAEFKDLLK